MQKRKTKSKEGAVKKRRCTKTCAASRRKASVPGPVPVYVRTPAAGAPPEETDIF